jgi:hypothetical protein
MRLPAALPARSASKCSEIKRLEAAFSAKQTSETFKSFHVASLLCVVGVSCTLDFSKKVVQRGGAIQPAVFSPDMTLVEPHFPLTGGV